MVQPQEQGLWRADASASRIGGLGRYGEQQENKKYQPKPGEFHRITIHLLKDGVEENVRVYAKEQCSIPTGMGKYIPVQKNCEIQGDV